LLFPDFQVGWFGELHTIATVLWDRVAEGGEEEEQSMCNCDLFNIPFFFPFLHTLFLHTHTILFALAQIPPPPTPSHTHHSEHMK